MEPKNSHRFVDCLCALLRQSGSRDCLAQHSDDCRRTIMFHVYSHVPLGILGTSVPNFNQERKVSHSYGDSLDLQSVSFAHQLVHMRSNMIVELEISEGMPIRGAYCGESCAAISNITSQRFLYCKAWYAAS